jgi:hypothetical protein
LTQSGLTIITFERWCMHVNLMREQCLYLSLEHYLPILD